MKWTAKGGRRRKKRVGEVSGVKRLGDRGGVRRERRDCKGRGKGLMFRPIP